MTKNELKLKISESAGISKVQAEAAINSMVGIITEALKDGDKVTLTGFGTFEVRERAARTCRDPRTGESIEVNAAKAPAFKASNTLKQAINK